MKHQNINIVVFLSGSGSNFQSIINAVQNGASLNIQAVFSDKKNANGLKRAEQAKIITHVFEKSQYPDRETYDAAVIEIVDQYKPDYIVLAGYMRILSKIFIDHYPSKILNIHPSLLPKYKGLNTHKRALEASDKEHGASVHLVTLALDDGPIIMQVKVPIIDQDTPDSLAKRVLEQEHKIYPLTLQWLSEQKLTIKHGQIFRNKQLLSQPILFNNLNSITD